MGRPLFLYDRTSLPARAAVGVPSHVTVPMNSTQVPARAILDYLYLNVEGPAGTSMVYPSDVTFNVKDKRQRLWFENVYGLPIEMANNMVRGRIDAPMWGDWVQTQIGAGANQLLPAGKYQIVTDSSLVHFQAFGNPPNAFVGASAPAGIVESDGANAQIINTDGANSHNFYTRRVDAWGFGEWWLPEPFELASRHTITVNVLNRMTVATAFEVAFFGQKKNSGQYVVLNQQVSVPAGGTRPCNFPNGTVLTDEPVLIKGMSYGLVHGSDVQSTAFDPRQIEMQIMPSQGNKWSDMPVPLACYSNVRGEAVGAFHVPLRTSTPNAQQPDSPEIFEANDYLLVDLFNYSASARVCQVVMAMHTV